MLRLGVPQHSHDPLIVPQPPRSLQTHQPTDPASPSPMITQVSAQYTPNQSSSTTSINGTYSHLPRIPLPEILQRSPKPMGRRNAFRAPHPKIRHQPRPSRLQARPQLSLHHTMQLASQRRPRASRAGDGHEGSTYVSGWGCVAAECCWAAGHYDRTASEQRRGSWEWAGE